MLIHERFKELRKYLKMTQTEFGEQLGKTMRTIQEYERANRAITDGVLLNLQEKFNVNIDWMRTGQGSMFLNDNKERTVSHADKGLLAFPKERDKLNYVEIPYYADIKASAGTGAFVGMEVSKMIPVSKDIIKNAYGLNIIEVSGDSMTPALYNKDKIIIDTNDKVLKKNKIYIIRKDSELYIKRYNSCINDMCIFTSDNPKYDSIIINKYDNSAVVGRLKGICMREIN